jgi:hypothetical protein
MKITLKSFWALSTLAILFLIISLNGCITIVKKDGTAGPTISTAPTTEAILITLERTPCYGTCPVYSLKISGDGEVIYEGKKYVKVLGVQKTTISKAAVQQLVSEFENAGYFGLNDNYTKYTVTDMPSANTSIAIGNRTKSINHYYGDRTAPEKLTALENKIDETVNSAPWIK